MKIIKNAQCSGVWDYGPWKGQRCTERRNVIKCSNALEPGCENYYCLLFHWSDHWKTHENEAS